MMPVTWPEVGAIHPFAPADQTEGYREMFATLEAALRINRNFGETPGPVAVLRAFGENWTEAKG